MYSVSHISLQEKQSSKSSDMEENYLFGKLCTKCSSFQNVIKKLKTPRRLPNFYFF